MQPNSSSDSPRDSANQFATTQWSLVLEAGKVGTDASRLALEKLCRAYWPPLYAYVRRRVSDVHQAQDLTQAFFELLLEKQYLADVDPGRGRFRAFLITAFKHFLCNEWERTRARKRGGGRVVFSVDFAAHEAGRGVFEKNLTAERIYERQWAVTLLNRVMIRLQRELERSGKGQQFHLLKGFIAGSGTSPYATVAAQLGIAESAARMAASRMRGRYRELLRDEIAQTVASDADVESEIGHLFAAFAK